jgi:hypothetical protein
VQRVLYYWYYVNERQLAQPLLTKLFFGLAAIPERPDAGVQIVSASCRINCDEARKRLEDWLSVYLPDGPNRVFGIDSINNL